MSGIKLTEMPVRIPSSATFELTLRCNLKCKMCLFRHEDCENSALKAAELSTEQWIDMARQTAELGTIDLLITGGEPMIRDDFCEIWEGIYRQGFLIELYTNATLVNEKIMETLRKYPPHRIGITLYGASEDTYQAVCGNGSMYRRAVDGIKQLMTLPSILNFRATIIKDNFHEAEAIARLVSEEFGYPENLTTTRIVNKGVRGACGKAEACRLEPKENIWLLHLLTRMRLKDIMGERYNEDAFRIEGYETTEPDYSECREEQQFSLLGCKGGMRQFTLTYDGRLLGCQMLDAFWTDARKSGLKEAWESYPFSVKLPERHEKCRSCKHMELCSICPAVIYAETGSLDGWPEYVCKDTEELLKLLGNKWKGGHRYETEI